MLGPDHSGLGHGNTIVSAVPADIRLSDTIDCRKVKRKIATTPKDEQKSESLAAGSPWQILELTEPNLYRGTFPYEELPRAFFDNQSVPMDVPEDIWVTDTSFRDGQQARTPYTVEQILAL